MAANVSRSPPWTSNEETARILQRNVKIGTLLFVVPEHSVKRIVMCRYIGCRMRYDPSFRM